MELIHGLSALQILDKTHITKTKTGMRAIAVIETAAGCFVPCWILPYPETKDMHILGDAFDTRGRLIGIDRVISITGAALKAGADLDARLTAGRLKPGEGTTMNRKTVTIFVTVYRASGVSAEKSIRVKASNEQEAVNRHFNSASRSCAYIYRGKNGYLTPDTLSKEEILSAFDLSLPDNSLDFFFDAMAAAEAVGSAAL